MAEGQGGPAMINVAAQWDDPDSLFHNMKRMLSVRRTEKAFGRGDMAWVDMGNPAVAAYYRTYEDRSLLILNNLSDNPQTVRLAGTDGDFDDILSGKTFGRVDTLTLEPYQYLWLRQTD